MYEASPLPKLTTLQENVLRLLAEGWSDSAIARRLNKTTGTVERTTHHIYHKLKITDRSRVTNTRVIAANIYRYYTTTQLHYASNE